MEYSSSEICQIASVTKKALRHYDKLKLLSPSRIDTNGYWYYNESSLNELQVIRNLQMIGFTLNEIKINLQNNCSQLRETIPEKLSYIDEQIMRLKLAKSLLNKIMSKSDIMPAEAISLSLDEEHLEWYKRNMSVEQYELVEQLMSQPESHAVHEKILTNLRSTKAYIEKDDKSAVGAILRDINNILFEYQLDEDTIHLLLEKFIESNLEGPLTQRILSIKESVYLLKLLN